MTPIISIIIPIFNAEKYLQRCIDSIIKQTFKNFELLLINDGSTDKSDILCDEFALKDNRIKVIHKINTGVSDTRNIGIINSTGKWITFIDADDWIEPSFLDTLYNHTKLSDIGVCVCDCIATNGEKELNSYIKIDNGIYTSKEYLRKLLLGQGVRFELWAKLYRKDLLDNIKSDTTLKIGEDYLMLVELCYKNNCKIHVINKKLYNYYINPNSVMNVNKNREKDYNLLITKFETFFINDKSNDIKYLLNIFILRHIWVILNRYCFRQMKLPKTYNTYIQNNLIYSKHYFKSEIYNILYTYSKNRYIGYLLWIMNKLYIKLKK